MIVDFIGCLLKDSPTNLLHDGQIHSKIDSAAYYPLPMLPMTPCADGPVKIIKKKQRHENEKLKKSTKDGLCELILENCILT